MLSSGLTIEGLNILGSDSTSSTVSSAPKATFHLSAQSQRPIWRFLYRLHLLCQRHQVKSKTCCEIHDSSTSKAQHVNHRGPRQVVVRPVQKIIAACITSTGNTDQARAAQVIDDPLILLRRQGPGLGDASLASYLSLSTSPHA